MEKVKSVAYQANGIASQVKIANERNTESVSELKESVKDIRVSQEQFRREYREDQKDLNFKLVELLKAVKQ